MRTRKPLTSYATIDHTYMTSDSKDRSPSVDRIRKRPPLQHAACFDQSDYYDFHINGRSKSVVQFRSRSTSLDRKDDNDTPETPSFGKSEDSDDHVTVKSGISFDLDGTYPEVFSKRDYDSEYQSYGDTIYERNYVFPKNSESEQKYHGESERNYRNRSEYFYDRPCASTDDDVYYNKSDDTFYNTCADVNDPLQIQRMSVTALFEKFCADEREVQCRPQPVRQASETCFRTNRLRGISSDRLGGMFIKKTRTDRMSTSSLGDHVGTGSCFSIFDKKKGKLSKLEKSKRLSTSALYDQSPTGNQIAKTTRIRSTEERIYKNFNSDELPKEEYYDINMPSTSKSDNFVTKFRFDENPLERAGVTKLYEKFCNDTPPKPVSLDNSLQSSRILEEQTLSNHSSPRIEPFSAASLSEKTSDIMSTTLKTNENIFNFNIDSENGDKSVSEVSNTVQLIFEDPRSNRTSVSDIYEPCFSISLTPRQPSFKRGSLKNNWMELASLDFKAIDDESPTTSKFSPDNTDVFMTPDYQFSFSVNGDTLPTLADIHEGDSIEENSISEYTSIKTKMAQSKSISSRSSMQKLQPIVLNNCKESDNGGDVIELSKLSIKNNCTELAVDSKKVRLRKSKVDSTKCFPL